jgi:hypothetical protein
MVCASGFIETQSVDFEWDCDFGIVESFADRAKSRQIVAAWPVSILAQSAEMRALRFRS